MPTVVPPSTHLHVPHNYPLPSVVLQPVLMSTGHTPMYTSAVSTLVRAQRRVPFRHPESYQCHDPSSSPWSDFVSSVLVFAAFTVETWLSGCRHTAAASVCTSMRSSVIWRYLCVHSHFHSNLRCLGGIFSCEHFQAGIYMRVKWNWVVLIFSFFSCMSQMTLNDLKHFTYWILTKTHTGICYSVSEFLWWCQMPMYSILLLKCPWWGCHPPWGCDGWVPEDDHWKSYALKSGFYSLCLSWTRRYSTKYTSFLDVFFLTCPNLQHTLPAYKYTL